CREYPEEASRAPGAPGLGCRRPGTRVSRLPGRTTAPHRFVEAQPLRRRIRGRSREAQAKGEAMKERITLHAELATILHARGNPWMSTKELAAAVNARGRYH